MSCSIIIVGNDATKRMTSTALDDTRVTSKSGCVTCESGRLISVTADASKPSGYDIDVSNTHPPKPAETWLLKFASSTTAQAWVDDYPALLAGKQILKFDPAL